MNKAQLVEAIADKMGGRQQAADAVDAVLDAIVRAVVAGDRVSVTGFGSFEKVDRPARYARNPQTGERVRVKKTSVPRFRAGQGFKDLVSGSKKLPKGGEVAVKKAPKGSLSGPPPTIAKAAGKKAAAKKATGARKTAAAATKKTAAKKTTATAKKTAAKKTTGTAKTAAAKKSTAAAKKTATKATAKKAPAKKATAKKAPARKSPARKTTTAKRASSARQ
ncbi:MULTISPECIES: HU family DNA-binding protein [unclassified Streptomyces]|uniref:HU family DNA-binding protein n=1 Tax=unclassified Streptomyces TaxID=2593676 RepID=UPI0004C018DB|nr:MULTISPECIES: HU family DNA-binding protein [unclassified Streptomyces]